jgi:hypothetical protein
VEQALRPLPTAVFAARVVFLDLARNRFFTSAVEAIGARPMKAEFSTALIEPERRSRHWHEAIATTYFPLDLEFRQADTFSGDLRIWQLGDLSLSRLTSGPLRYRRLPYHFASERQEQFLITVPVRSEVYFSQCGKDVRCNPGGFILERSHEPYEFSHAEDAGLWVLKVDADALRTQIRSPERFCSMEFDASEGTGGLFVDMLQAIPLRFDGMSADSRGWLENSLSIYWSCRSDPTSER